MDSRPWAFILRCRGTSQFSRTGPICHAFANRLNLGGKCLGLTEGRCALELKGEARPGTVGHAER